MTKSQTATIKHIETIAKDTLLVTFQGPPNFNFAAGQYITITLPALANRPDVEQYRDFSVASAPKLAPEFQVALRQTNSLFKSALQILPIGTEVQLDGPAGVFTLSKLDTIRVFVAGGIGITPFRSMFGDMNDHSNTELIYYNKDKQSVIFLDELPAISNFKYTVLYGKPSLSHFEIFQPRLTHISWYIAGPPDMVASVRRLLKALAVNDTMIRTEEFSGYESSQ